MQSRLKRAFSLVELLVVVAVIGIVATFAVPAVSGMLRGSALTTAASTVVDQMSLARQHALSKNRLVEARLYRFADPETPGEDVTQPATGYFRAFQFFEMSEAGVMVPIGKVVRLADTIVMHFSPTLSDILAEDPALIVTPDSKTDPELPRGVKHQYEYRAFRFFPDGTTSLSPTGVSGKPSAGGRWFATLLAINDINRTEGGTTPPPNFATWMIDPVTGTSKILRPGVK